MCCRVVTALIYGETAELWIYLQCAGLTLGFGLALLLLTRRQRAELKPRDGYLLVSLSWLFVTAAAALPLMRGVPHLSFTDAYFEAMSGLSTTGSTVINGLDNLPHAVNLWRHALHWLGGMGIIVLAVAILPLLGVGGMQMYRAETPGPVKDAKLTPRITETAKALWLVYAGITVACIASLIAGRDAALRCHLPCVLRHVAGRVLDPRRQHRVFPFAGHRDRADDLHGHRRHELLHALRGHPPR